MIVYSEEQSGLVVWFKKIADRKFQSHLNKFKKAFPGAEFLSDRQAWQLPYEFEIHDLERFASRVKEELKIDPHSPGETAQPPVEEFVPEGPCGCYQTSYAVLGLLPSADEVVIRAAYRVLSLKYHPDKQGDSTRMEQVNRAFEEIRKERNFG